VGLVVRQQETGPAVSKSLAMHLRRAASAVFAVALAVPLLAVSGASAQTPAGDAVVAFIDTGINPYHAVFRDDSLRGQQHPSTYLPGFPADAEALTLTLDAETYADAVTADCERVWRKVQPGKLYWFPGTKIVGAISFLAPHAVGCSPASASAITGEPFVLDSNGHGTMVASRAASTQYGACATCRIVSVQYPGSVNLVGPGGSEDRPIASIRWAAANAGWIDAQSNSWGPIVPLYDPTGAAGLLTSSAELVRAVEEVSQAHPAFWASGNGAAFRAGVVGHPTLLSPHLTPSAISVGGHDSGFVNLWPGFPPHVVADSCADRAAKHTHLTESGDTVGGGTSAATPYVAGGAAQVLVTARTILGDTRTGVRTGGVVAQGPAGLVPTGPLADGTLTVTELKRLVMVTATTRPLAQAEDGPTCGAGPYGPTPVRWADVPAAYPEYINIGYGAVDRPAVARAEAVLRGAAAAPDRAATDRYFGVDAAARDALHTVFRGPGT
jgi:hypothetical protein